MKRSPTKSPTKKKIDTLKTWRIMRNSELKRRSKIRTYNMYKNRWFISLVKEATKVEYWVQYDIARLKNIRNRIESEYKVEIGYFSAFVYFTTYRFLHWSKRSLEYKNFIGYMQNENNLVEFANYIGKKPINLRIRVSRWPDDYEEKWGKISSLKTLKVGKNDKFVKTHLMSIKMDKEFKKYLGD